MLSLIKTPHVTLIYNLAKSSQYSACHLSPLLLAILACLLPTSYSSTSFTKNKQNPHKGLSLLRCIKQSHFAL